MKELTQAIVLTGGIATGKSTALSVFRSLGFSSIDADVVAHQYLDEQAHTVAHYWGQEYLLANGKVNRVKLGELIFQHAQEKQRLEGLLHPLIQAEIYRQALSLETQGKIYFIDIPLFFEYPTYDIATSLLIYCPREQQKQRLMQRNKLTEQEAQQRLENQLDIEKKKQLATFIIDNSTSKQALTIACENFIKTI